MWFAGLTNGVVGPVARTYGRLAPGNAATIQKWLAAGTNGALFVITNRQRYGIRLSEYGTIVPEGSVTGQRAPLLNVGFGGLYVPAGQAATVVVPVLTSEPRWKARLYYSMWESKSERLLSELSWRLQSIPEKLAARPRSWPVHTVESDWVPDQRGTPAVE